MLTAGRLADADQWLCNCLALIDQQQWIAFRPWPVAVLSESRLRRDVPPAGLRPALEQAFALSCQVQDPCWEAAIARTLALTYAIEDELAKSMDWLREARKRSARDTDVYAALQVSILANQTEISSRHGPIDAADAYAREWVSLAARTHMDAHVERAAAFIRR